MSKPDHHGGLSNRQVWIAAVAGGVLLVVGLVVAVGTAGGSGPTPHRSAVAGPSTSAPRVPPPATSGSPGPTGAPGAPAGSVVRWSGALAVPGPDADRDLDALPPRTSRGGADLTGATFDDTLNAATGGAQLVVVPGSPGYRQCRDAVTARGTDSTAEPVQAGDVVCVLTDQRRVARLRVRKATVGFPAATVRGDVTVWDPPLPR